MEYNQKVPRDLKKNLLYRQEINQKCLEDKRFRNTIINACRDDVLFFLNTFAWVYEPRPKIVEGYKWPMTIPFIAWEHQEPAIKAISGALGIRDIGVEKSRGEGMSWMGVLLAVHNWTFIPGSKVGMVSSTMDKAHKAGDMDSLLEKVYWEIKRLPVWMVGREDDSGRDATADWTLKIAEHIIHNRRNNSLISASAAVGGAGRGGRYSWYLMDELSEWDRGPDDRVMASTQQATNCRLVVATPLGNEGAYYKFMHAPSNKLPVILDWKMNPVRNRGLYEMVRGRPQAVQEDNPLPPHYAVPTKDVKDMWARLVAKGFRLDKGLRSPWYDNECDRADSTPQSIAQELDRDYGGSMAKIFSPEFFKAAEKTARSPVKLGELRHDVDLKPTFLDREDGPVKLWCGLDHAGSPPKHPYVVGCDIATGIGGSYSSNSVIQVIDLYTREQVCEYAVNTMEPGEFCDLAIAFCNWFNEAHLIWETNGIGGAFTNRLKEQKYHNVYRMRSLKTKGRSQTRNIGWIMSRESKAMLVSDFILEVKTGGIQLRSRDLIRECGQYVMENGKITYVMSAEDKALGGEEHGDRAMAFGMAVQAMRSRPLDPGEKAEESAKEAPYGSLAWRMQKWREEEETEENLEEMDFTELYHRMSVPV